MKKNFLTILLCASIFFFPLTTHAIGKPKILLVSIDGLKYSHIIDAQKRGISLPNFQRFIQNGSYATGVVGVFPTLTYPSHTSLITGVSPKTHGITHNFIFEPERKQQNYWTWFSEDIRVPTLWDEAKENGFTTANVDWPVSVGASIDYNIVQYWHAGTKTDTRLIRALSTPHLVQTIEKEINDHYPVGDWSLQGDKKRLQFAQYIIREYHPDFMTLYFASLDDVQHKTGSASQETFATLAGLDTILGQLLETVQKKYGNNTVIALVSDHGFVPVKKSINLNAAFQKSGLIQLDSGNQLVDWKVYSLSGEGITKIRLKNKKDEVTYQRVRALLKQLATNPTNGIDRVLEQPQISRLGGFPEADFVVASKPGYVFRDKLTGPVINKKTDYLGSHGFMPDFADMQSSFFIMGKNIPKRKNLGTISMLDIAPTLAALQGMELDQAEGHVLNLKY